MKFSSYAKKELKLAWIIAFALVMLGSILYLHWDPAAGLALAGISILAWLAFIMFFRDPQRKIPEDPFVFVSPADGVVRDIELITESEENKYFEGHNALRIGIFLSVFDVHINRAPFDMIVKEVKHREGKYYDARTPDAIEENEAVTMIGSFSIEGQDYPIIVKQISGAIARRIVCEVSPEQKLSKGERYGMIKFGSRTELYVPAKPCFELLIKVGDRVYGGVTPLLKYNRRNSE